jgi:hypothetical protein
MESRSNRFIGWPAMLCSAALLVSVGCRTAAPVEQPTVAPPVEVREPEPPTTSLLYATDEAIQDALSSEWEYLGTGPWPGIERSHACVFRNARVLIVNAYCTLTERQAFRIDVYSPERGRVRVYAEADGPVSSRQRDDYFIFTAESEPPPESSTSLGAVTLAMDFGDLQGYEQQRYEAFLPGCYGGQRHGDAVGGCLGDLSGHAEEWAARNRDFLEHASDDWYRVVREMRTLARRHGFDPR